MALKEKKTISPIVDEKTTAINPIVNAVFKQEETAFGRIYATLQIYIELGRRQTMYFDDRMYDQITIRDIKLHPDLQQHGILTSLVRHILIDLKCQAVQLEAVQSKMLMGKLKKSPLWKPVSKHSNSYFRCFDSTKEFSLF
jgi:hypothetical protein